MRSSCTSSSAAAQFKEMGVGLGFIVAVRSFSPCDGLPRVPGLHVKLNLRHIFEHCKGEGGAMEKLAAGRSDHVACDGASVMRVDARPDDAVAGKDALLPGRRKAPSLRVVPGRRVGEAVALTLAFFDLGSKFEKKWRSIFLVL